jgi:hypothetical protein
MQSAAARTATVSRPSERRPSGIMGAFDRAVGERGASFIILIPR